jgi:hypothetical protein
MSSKRRLFKRGLVLLSFLLVLGGILASLSIMVYAHQRQTTSQAFSDAMPNLRLPWLYGSYAITQSYNCSYDSTMPDHVGKDKFAIDFALPDTPTRTQVTAVFSGTVHIGQFDGKGYGNNLWVSNGNWRAVYGHLSDDIKKSDGTIIKGIQVTEGQSVTQGQVLGLSGRTGWATGPHLHFALRYGGVDKYDGSPEKPEPMSGYTGFGDDKNCVTPTRLYNPGPGGFWIGPTPSGGYQNPISAGTQIDLGFQANDNNNRGLKYVHFTKSEDNGKTWIILQNDYTKAVNNGQVQYFAHFFMPNKPVILSADVGSNNDSFQLAPNGLRYLCLSSNQCPTPLVAYNGPNGDGYGGNPTPTPSPTNGFQVCQNTNYGQPCEVFHYTSHDTCISLDQMAGHNKSVEYIGDYVNDYSAVMYHDNNCGTYLARYDNNNPDIGWGLYDQFSSMRLEQHMPPDATQVSPINGATLPSGTTETDVSFSGTAPFTLHVWDLTTHYDVWQPNISATTFHISGLQDGATYNWQIIGNIGPWSGQWAFSVASSQSTPSPTSTQPPVSNTPQGVWVNQGSSCAWQPNTSCTLTLQVTSGVPLTSVNILAEWNQTWYTLCKDTQPNSGTVNQYNCTITDWHTTDNFNYPPNGPIRFRADAYDTSGNVTYYVGGDFWITFGQ